MQYKGFIKLYRKLLASDIKEIGIQGIGFACYCLLKANHKDAQWFDGSNYQDIKRGQFITSLPQIAGDLKVGIQVIRTLLKKFTRLDFLTDKPTNKYRLITIVNYSKYQDKPEELTDEPTGKQQAANRQLTANKNDKNKKNEKKDIYLDFEFFKNQNFIEAYEGYLEMRKKKRKVPTERAEKMVLNKLHQHKLEIAILMLNKSILHSWTDVYELKSDEVPVSLPEPKQPELVEEMTNKQVAANRRALKKMREQLSNKFLWKINN